VLPGTEGALVAELAVTCWRRTGRISVAVLWLQATVVMLLLVE